jgi:hypothetical protein
VRALLSEIDAYYGWLFLMRVLTVNKVAPLNVAKIVCRLNLYLIDMIPFLTRREAEHLVPVLANASAELMQSQSSSRYAKVLLYLSRSLGSMYSTNHFKKRS